MVLGLPMETVETHAMSTRASKPTRLTFVDGIGQVRIRIEEIGTWKRQGAHILTKYWKRSVVHINGV